MWRMWGRYKIRILQNYNSDEYHHNTMTNIITMIIIDHHTHGLPCWRTPRTSSWSSRACAQGGIQGAAARTAWTTNSTKNTRPSLTRTRHINGIVKDTFLVVIWIPITRMAMVIATRVDVLVIPLAELSTCLCYHIIMLLYYYYHSIDRTLHLCKYCF